MMQLKYFRAALFAATTILAACASAQWTAVQRWDPSGNTDKAVATAVDHRGNVIVVGNGVYGTSGSNLQSEIRRSNFMVVET